MYRALKQSPMLEPAKVHHALTWQILRLNISREDTLIIPFP
jgi:hypothetical protein